MIHRDPIVEFIGIGAQKCGTSWIHRNLTLHPGIYVAKGKDKDTQFFSCYYDHGYQWYEQKFTNSSSTEKSGEVSTSYLYNGDSPQRIKNYNPDVKLFVCLRNPVERIVSNHKHEIRTGHISGKNLSLAVALRNNPAYIQQTRYAHHLKRWYQYFDKEQIKIMFFDDLKDKPLVFIQDLYKFLQVNSDFTPPKLGEASNVSRIPVSQGAEKSIRGAGKVLRTIGLQKLVDQGRKLGFNDWLRKTNTANQAPEKVEITEEALITIRAALQDEVAELADMTGRDLSAWTI